MSRYINTKADVVFWKVFGQHEHLVLSLLNALLPLEDGKQVERVKCQDAAYPYRTQFSNQTIFEVECEETGGRKFIVEMQMNWNASDEHRERLCEAKSVAAKSRKGTDDSLRRSVYVLDLVNDTLEPNDGDYYHYYRFGHSQDSCNEQDDLHLVLVELTKFKIANVAEKKMRVLWLRFLTEIDENTRRAPRVLVDDPLVNEALEIVEDLTFSRGVMLAYDKFWDRISIEATVRRDAAVASRDAALERLRQTVRQMKADGMSAEAISKYTGMSAEEIGRVG